MIHEETNIKEPVAVDTNEPVIEIKGLYKSFGKDNEVLKGVDLVVNKSENLVVLGKSGSGKSILIKCLVGLVAADKGEIKVFGTDINTLDNNQLNAIRVRIGFLFQNSALYDSMTVRENLAFPLKRHSKKLSAEEVEAAVIAALDNVGLADAVDKMPAELSGGMRKRAGLARALALDPDLAYAHIARGWLLENDRLDWAGATHEYKTAMRLAPELMQNRFSVGSMLALHGQLQEGVRLTREAVSYTHLTLPTSDLV